MSDFTTGPESHADAVPTPSASERAGEEQLYAIVDVRIPPAHVLIVDAPWRVVVVAEGAPTEQRQAVRHVASVNDAVRAGHEMLDAIVADLGIPLAGTAWVSDGSGPAWRKMANAFSLDYIRPQDCVRNHP